MRGGKIRVLNVLSSLDKGGAETLVLTLIGKHDREDFGCHRPVRSAVAIPLPYFLITKIGLLGGAISYVTAFWLGRIILLHTAKKGINATLGQFLPWKKLLIIFLISVAPAVVLPYLLRLGMSNFGTLLTAALVYFTIVGTAFKFMGYIRIKEFKSILKKS